MTIKEIKNFFLSNCNGSFTFNKITEFINKCNNYYIIKYNNITFTILHNNPKINIKYYNKITYRIFNILSMLKCDKIINYYILLSPYKRFIPSNNDIIKPININGGFVYLNKNEIFIYRKEELPKVLIHETLHLINTIDNQQWSHKNVLRLRKHFNIDDKCDLIPNEAVIEFLATIYHLNSISKNDNFNKLLNDEIKYSKYKCYQLLNKYKKNKWIEESNTYCYIIFKTILLDNYKLFMKNITFPYNDNYITNFLIKNSNIKGLKNINPFKKIPNNSLRMMIYSDL